MASIPVTAYSAAKVHEYVRQHYKDEKPGEDPNSGNAFHTTAFVTEKDVPNYNSKLMNSIWGRYNLYAAHAFQKNNEGIQTSGLAFAVPQAKKFSLWDCIRSFY